MGMAASQARFLGLTARKTNVEYQGQQVNQARTILANESAGLFNSMMVLKVPTPPVVNDYYIKRFQFQGTDLGSVTLDSVKENGSGQIPPLYDIKMSYQKNVLKGAQSGSADIAVTPKVPATTPVTYDYKIGSVALTEPIINPVGQPESEDQKNIAALKKYLGYGDDQQFFVYQKTATEKYYVERDTTTTPPVNYSSPLNYTANVKTPATAEGVATIQIDESSGRYTSIKFASVDEDAKDYVKTGIDYDLTISNEYDQQAYEQATQNYNFAKMQYENELGVINAKTEKLQMEDRTLELKLRQLDTEQKALQTEMESVQKVIQKNVEVTFKTFA